MNFKKTLTVGILVLATAQVEAATWNTFSQAYNEESLFFFDADTVIKAGDTTTVWIKYVKTHAPDDDGSWSTAQRTVVNCKKHTTQTVAVSLYAKDQKFMRSANGVSKETEPAPESILEELVKAVCTPDFPKSTAKKNYFPVANNDIYTHTASYYQYMLSQKDSAPK